MPSATGSTPVLKSCLDPLQLEPEPLHEGRAAPDKPRRRVLIVDDDLDFLEVAEASLAAPGFDALRASGGLSGVFLATQDVPDAIICDLRMPGIDGFVVAEALRADPATSHLAILACTGRRDLEARAAAVVGLRRGADEAGRPGRGGPLPRRPHRSTA